MTEFENGKLEDISLYGMIDYFKSEACKGKITLHHFSIDLNNRRTQMIDLDPEFIIPISIEVLLCLALIVCLYSLIQ